MKLLFSQANSKLRKLEKRLKKKVYSLDLVAGWSCPFAKLCKSKVVGTPNGLRIKDGKYTQFRCFSASEEVVYSHVFLRRLKNFQTIKGLCKTPNKLVRCIDSSIPLDAEVIRLHVSGDFFNKNYLKAIISVAVNNPDKEFYGYTKAIQYLLELKSIFPKNLRLVASYGGTQDKLILPNKLISSTVINTVDEAKELGLKIDYDDFLAYDYKKSFGLLIHGVQPKIYSVNNYSKGEIVV
jgi:hypothetical protein